jgi:hypothetical protein
LRVAVANVDLSSSLNLPRWKAIEAGLSDGGDPSLDHHSVELLRMQSQTIHLSLCAFHARNKVLPDMYHDKDVLPEAHVGKSQEEIRNY